VATWSWPTWVVELETCVASRVHLVGVLSPSRRIFIGSHSLPLSGSPFRSFKDITNQEVRGFDDGEVLQRVQNVDKQLRDVEFQRVYIPYELARLNQFIEDSKKPLYPDCHKYSHLSGDLKLLQLKANHG
jgi:hypothetical protein